MGKKLILLVMPTIMTSQSETPCTRRGEVRCLYIKVDTAVTIHASINYRYHWYIYFKIPIPHQANQHLVFAHFRR
jgi:hypothetical protein